MTNGIMRQTHSVRIRFASIAPMVSHTSGRLECTVARPSGTAAAEKGKKDDTVVDKVTDTCTCVDTGAVWNGMKWKDECFTHKAGAVCHGPMHPRTGPPKQPSHGPTDTSGANLVLHRHGRKGGECGSRGSNLWRGGRLCLYNRITTVWSCILPQQLRSQEQWPDGPAVLAQGWGRCFTNGGLVVV